MKTWIAGFLSGVCMMMWAIILVGCATPTSHEAWATRCLEESGDDFKACVEKWDAWARDELEGR